MMHLQPFEKIEEFLNTKGLAKTHIREVKRVQLKAFTDAQKEALLDRQRAHWAKLHTTRFTPEEFESWIASIPGCSSCQRDFRKLLETNPPRYNDWQRWSWEIHNQVNAKIGKPEIDWQSACELWGWST